MWLIVADKFGLRLLLCELVFDHRCSVVLTEVIHELYKNLSPASESSTRLCLMFIDAAHQYEAMLDVLLVLGHIDILFLKSGCEELISMHQSLFCFGRYLTLYSYVLRS